jgi:hypothetical protein
MAMPIPASSSVTVTSVEPLAFIKVTCFEALVIVDSCSEPLISPSIAAS